MSIFSADKQALGYLFQFRYALLAFLKAPSFADLVVEGLDDISFEESGDLYQLVQTKHSARQANLTDRSQDLWKTLRVWSTHIKDQKVDVDSIELILVTTAKPAKNSVASYLSLEAAGNRNVATALSILNDIAEEQNNESNKLSYKAFKSLDSQTRAKLVSKTTVVTSSPDIEATKNLIKTELEFTVRPEFCEDFFMRLEGWWLSRIIKHLASKTDNVILRKELTAQIADFAEQYHKDNLPIHFENTEAPIESDLSEKERNFLEQLRLIEVQPDRLKQAIGDYYRAFQQRSKWVREGNLLVGDLDRYEEKLINEWSRLFLSMKEDLNGKSTPEELVKAGRQLYNRIEQQVQIPIRPRCTEPYVMRGTYHSLANSGRVGWHLDFKGRLKALFEKVMEDVVGTASPKDL
jgi:hypothetical protein